MLHGADKDEKHFEKKNEIALKKNRKNKAKQGKM